MNLVMNASGEFIEVQGTGEESAFSEQELAAMLALGKTGIRELLTLQQAVLNSTTSHPANPPTAGS
jgi:ribonuclease PH